MMLSNWGDAGAQGEIVERHLREMRAEAAGDRLARRQKGLHRLRRTVGGLLIAAGQALVTP